MRKQKNILLILLCTFSLIICTLFIISDANNYIEHIKISVFADDSSEEITLFKNGETYYAFLPSYTKLETIRFVAPEGYKILINDIESEKAEISVNEQYNLKIKNPIGITLCNEKLHILQSANIAGLHIKLSNGNIEEINSDKTIEKTGNIKYINSQAEVLYNGSFKSLHGRGNSSWEKEKKPYVVEFDDIVNLGGFCNSQKYCLIASANEGSNLRNKIAYDLALAIGLENSPESEFVDLYIDGTYYGLYLLTEKIDVSEEQLNINPLEEQTQQINQFKLSTYTPYNFTNGTIFKNALEIKNNPGDITGGYLVELEYAARAYTETCSFSVESGLAFNVKYPASCSVEQIEYISNFFQQAEDSLSTDNFDDFIDLQSFAKYYIIQEFLANADKASHYYYKDSDAIDSTLHADYIWDFDISMGLGDNTDDTSPYQYYVNNWGWFEKLYNQPIFRETVKEIYVSQFRDIAKQLLEKNLDDYQQKIEQSWLMNKYRWQNIQLYDWYVFPETLEGNVEQIYCFIENRLLCFDHNYLEDIPLIKVGFVSEGEVTYNNYFYFDYGSYPTPPKQASTDTLAFVGWYNSNGEELTANTAVTEDTVYYAKWERVPSSQQNKNASFENILNISKAYIPFLLFGIICIVVVGTVFKDVIIAIKQRKKI